jgi:hypothetical protein
VYFQNALCCDPVLWFPLCISRIHSVVIQCCNIVEPKGLSVRCVRFGYQIQSNCW